MTHKTIIIGSGPAGYTAAIYAGRANMEPVVYSGLQPGGQLTQTTIVENFPGYPQGVDANQMMMELREQAERFGADVRDGLITDVDFSQRPYRLTTDRGENLSAHTVIIATGASAKYLGLADEQTYMGRGVSACATCDGFFYRKKTVAVVGGGDTACEEATYLAQLAKKVYMIVRKPYLRASDIMRQRVEQNEKIEILYEHNTLGLYGCSCGEAKGRSRRADIRPAYRRILPRNRTQAQYRAVCQVAGARRDGLPEDSGRHPLHVVAGHLCCRRLCRPTLPSGHRCRW